MCKKIVVMGGSFNPPTIAHKKLMIAAVDSLQADMGIYVPSSHEYVKRKMDRAKFPLEVLDEELRLQMLWKMIEDDSRFIVDDFEYHLTEKSRTYNTMVYLQGKYPDAELFFLAGGDKIDIFPRWYRIKDFLNQFRIIITKRDNYDVDAALLEHPFLNSQKDRFVVIDYPYETEGISSSVVREMWRTENYVGAKEMLHPAVYKIMQTPTDYVINEFRGQYSFLSNFYESSVMYKGLTYQNAESAFQAQKCLNEDEKIRFTQCNPSKAKNMGRRAQLRPDWEEVKLLIMEEIVYEKFKQNEQLKDMLLATGNAVLKEGNAWNDVFWGISSRTGKGKNNLGKILMKVREKLYLEIS